ncbi:alpha/beta fold hydrolase [Paraburkholderia phenoliruptrix]|uniref:alpha/beta fold hydrolase n=1 Tax=Paraburkholderia phenoliruptrix TaxID=252970 RepID=UPI001C6EAA75|nr:alpha/beta fold hydrolase [Paraburkholderia phenoliruptrix]MBW9106812.1 alpha/beta fold hydrolase [Paraburkholderia phenoliruptrix]MBW9131799.1 alpha/beta fold hydrolase [Paraburkholderia ginsengiterrae]
MKRLFPIALLIAALAALALSGCGGDLQENDPLASYKSQHIAWQPCSATQTAGLDTLDVAALGADLACGELAVPEDYDHPSAGDIRIGVMRVSALAPSQRLGAIVFNPGGPGGDGYSLGAQIAGVARLANPSSGGYRAVYDMARKYDFVGFSPRGVGFSTRLECTLGKPLVHTNYLPADMSNENINNALANMKVVADACRDVPFARFVNTDATARDMDVLRAALGEAKLNFIGYSYGTLLGAWYASLFPQRAGRMLLDSVVDYDVPMPLQSQAVAEQTAYDDILSLYALTMADQVAIPNTIEGIRGLVTATPDWAKSYFAGLMYQVAPHRGKIGLVVPLMAAETAVIQVAASHPSVEQYRAALTQYLYSPMDTTIDGAAREAALGTVDTYQAYLTNHYVVGNASDLPWVNFTVRCSDAPVPSSPAYWIARAVAIVKAAPIHDSSDINNPCMFWGPVTVQKPALANAARTASPLLLLQSEYDVLTPLPGALATFNDMPHASMIQVQGEYTHGLFPYGTSCVDASVANYFLSGATPARNTSCAGIAIQGVPQATPSAAAAVAHSAMDDAPLFTDPVAAKRLLERIHDTVGQAQPAAF